MNGWVSIPIPRNLEEFYRGYMLPLARAFHAIEKRGVQVDEVRLGDLRSYLLVSLEEIAKREDYWNLSSSIDSKKIVAACGLEVPYNPHTRRYGVDDYALNLLYAQSNDEVILGYIQTRELSKILTTYVETVLHNGILYYSFSVSGTVNGRRSAHKNLFGLGTNPQNLPKHSLIGQKYRECLVAGDGRIFVSCDQEQAEDWIVNACIASRSQGADTSGLDELQLGVDRHARLASQIFSKPEAACGKGTPERFMGKKKGTPR
jgi:DNA polymerase I-like protein with 3'-5' exonuclease and polymerase domains